MIKKQKGSKPRVAPWPNCSFALKTHWEDWGTGRHFWVHLERRAPGKFGCLEAMHAIVPSGHQKNDVGSLFRSARYRKGTLDGAREFFQMAGVPEEQARVFMDAILKEYPYPTAKELFLEQISSPFMVLALGERRNELSYYRTGVPELTSEDMHLFEQRLKEWDVRLQASPGEREKFLEVMFGRGVR
jgi:hypothetical protein